METGSSLTKSRFFDSKNGEKVKIDCEHDLYLVYEGIIPKLCKFHDFLFMRIRMRSAKLGNYLKLFLVVFHSDSNEALWKSACTFVRIIMIIYPCFSTEDAVWHTC